MKIIGVSASPRGDTSTTKKLLSTLLMSAKEVGAETELIDICKADIKYCLGCNFCYQTGGCQINDAAFGLIKKLKCADGVVFSSPTFILNISGQMKTFMDRSGYFVYCQYLAGTYGLSIAAANSSTAESICNIQNRYLFDSGCTIIGSVPVSHVLDASSYNKGIENAKDMGLKLVKAIQTGYQDPEQDARRARHLSRMRTFVETHKNDWMATYLYWKENEML